MKRSIRIYNILLLKEWRYRAKIYFLILCKTASQNARIFILKTNRKKQRHKKVIKNLFQKWWTDLWLKEGFANFMAALCVDNLHPEFDIMTRFLINEIICAQKLDALQNRSVDLKVKIETLPTLHLPLCLAVVGIRTRNIAVRCRVLNLLHYII